MLSLENKKTKKALLTFFLCAFLFSCFFVFLPERSLAEVVPSNNDTLAAATDSGEKESGNLFSDFFNGAKTMAKGIIIAPLVVIRKFVAIILDVAMNSINLMLSEAMYSQVFFSSEARTALNTGWGLVRDFVNMFYVLILIFLAIATILRVNKFSDKKLLLSVVISALLVNFSKPITLFIIDMSNLAMNFFMSNISSVQYNYASLMADRLNFGDLISGNKAFDTDGIILIMLSEIVFSVVFAITLFVLAVALLIRLVSFWVLLVLSPLAFFGLALPGTSMEGWFKTWLEKMVNWALFGPVLLFFLWLSIVLIDALSNAKLGSGIPGINQSPIAYSEGEKSFVINFFKNLIPFVAAIYMLFYGFEQSRKIAEKAGSSVGGWMKRGEAWMNKGVRYSAIAGTGFAGAAGYAGYKGAKEAGAGLKQRAENNKYAKLFTKKGREEASEKRVARWAGDTEKIDRDKANESYKKMKDSGQTEKEVIGNLSSSDKYTAAGAAKLAAEKGWLGKQADYEAAANAAGKVKPIESQFNTVVKKNNLNSVINHALNKKAKGLSLGGASDLSVDQSNEVLDEYMENKGVADFAKEGQAFFENPAVYTYIANKYSGVNMDIKNAAIKKASDKISDPKKLQTAINAIKERR